MLLQNYLFKLFKTNCFGRTVGRSWWRSGIELTYNADHNKELVTAAHNQRQLIWYTQRLEHWLIHTCWTDLTATCCVASHFTHLIGIKCLHLFQKQVKMIIMSTYPALQLHSLREISPEALPKHTCSACSASLFRMDWKHLAFATTSPWCADTLILCR